MSYVDCEAPSQDFIEIRGRFYQTSQNYMMTFPKAKEYCELQNSQLALEMQIHNLEDIANLTGSRLSMSSSSW